MPTVVDPAAPPMAPPLPPTAERATQLLRPTRPQLHHLLGQRLHKEAQRRDSGHPASGLACDQMMRRMMMMATAAAAAAAMTLKGAVRGAPPAAREAVQLLQLHHVVPRQLPLPLPLHEDARRSLQAAQALVAFGAVATQGCTCRWTRSSQALQTRCGTGSSSWMCTQRQGAA